MKTISQEALKKKMKRGWAVDKVVKGKPKKKPTPRIKEQVAASVTDTNRAIKDMAVAMKTCFDEQLKSNTKLGIQIQNVADRKIIVELPATKVTPKKRKWKFNIVRDGRGFTENITAEEI